MGGLRSLAYLDWRHYVTYSRRDPEELWVQAELRLTAGTFQLSFHSSSLNRLS